MIDIREIGKTSKHIKWISYQDNILTLYFDKDVTFEYTNFSEEQWNKVLSYDDLDICMKEYLSQYMNDESNYF